jgi:hypothetical protein
MSIAVYRVSEWDMAVCRTVLSSKDGLPTDGAAIFRKAGTTGQRELLVGLGLWL